MVHGLNGEAEPKTRRCSVCPRTVTLLYNVCVCFRCGFSACPPFFEGEEGVLRQHFLMGRQMGKLEDGERKKRRLLAAKRALISSLG